LPGDELTIVTYGTLVHVAIAAAQATGVDAEVIDVRTMAPLDVKTLADSVKKTGRAAWLPTKRLVSAVTALSSRPPSRKSASIISRRR
jgi:2-oxoisovalerate dehydrogenase E1 component beta subunit